MKRLWLGFKTLNWKYIFGEIVLLFVGISLAIWFNNWNSSSKLNQDRQLALNKITDEIRSNILELQKAIEGNTQTLQAFTAYKKVYSGSSTEVITTAAHMKALQDSFPNFFRIKSALPLQKDTFHYYGGTFVNLELAELTDIAWTTSQSVDITNTFRYECLYQLASMYQLQQRLHKEMDRATQALQERRLEDLIHVLEFTHQFEKQLEEDYKSTLENMKDCHKR